LPAKGKKSYSIQSVDNALDLLEALSDEGDEVRTSRLGERLGMNKTSLFRYLATFENRGYVEHIKGSGKYRLGPSAYEIGQKFLSRMGLLRKARPVMEKMVRECDEAAYIVVRRDSDALFLDMVDTSQQVKIISLAGKRYPVKVPAAGRVLLAYGAGVEDSAVDPTLTEELSRTHRQGYCLDRGAIGDGITSVAVPLFSTGGKLQASLSFVGPDFRLPQERIDSQLLPRLIEAGMIISSKLGHFSDKA
jgi:IclR family KDG regulon transcriptional repressor